LEAMRSFAAILLLAASLFAAPPPWTPGGFRGLTVGRAHRADALRVLGQPDLATPTPGGEDLLYKARGDHHGDLTVRLNRSGLITEIQELFPVAIPRTHIYKELGGDALTAHFSWTKCAGNALYRDPRGAVELTLYPARGIALWPDQVGYDFAAIRYLARQPGLAHPPACLSRR
jgi:hypothetical protein